MTLDLTRIEAEHAATTQGEWEFVSTQNRVFTIAALDAKDCPLVCFEITKGSHTREGFEDNWKWICSAHAAIPLLVERVRELENELAGHRQAELKLAILSALSRENQGVWIAGEEFKLYRTLRQFQTEPYFQALLDAALAAEGWFVWDEINGLVFVPSQKFRPLYTAWEAEQGDKT